MTFICSIFWETAKFILFEELSAAFNLILKMCFSFVKPKRAVAKNGNKLDKNDSRGIRPGLEVNKDKPERNCIQSPKSAVQEAPFDDKPGRDRKQNMIPSPRKQQKLLSSTPKDVALQSEDLKDECFITQMVQIESSNDLFKRMLYQSSKSLKLDENLWNWRMNVKERVETFPTEELTNQYQANLQQLIEDLSKAVIKADAVRMISKAAKKPSNHDSKHVSKQMLAKNNHIFRSLNSVIVRQTRDRFWTMLEGQPTPLAVGTELSKFVLAASRLEENLSRFDSPS